jgi:hypothetical protein
MLDTEAPAEADEGVLALDAIDQFDLVSTAATGALEVARTLASWIAAHGRNLDPEQKVHQLLRARDLAALAASHLNELAHMLDPGDEDDGEPDVVPCGHSVCASAYINGGEKECIEEAPDDEDDEIEGDNELLSQDELSDDDDGEYDEDEEA